MRLVFKTRVQPDARPRCTHASPAASRSDSPRPGAKARPRRVAAHPAAADALQGGASKQSQSDSFCAASEAEAFASEHAAGIVSREESHRRCDSGPAERPCNPLQGPQTRPACVSTRLLTARSTAATSIEAPFNREVGRRGKQPDKRDSGPGGLSGGTHRSTSRGFEQPAGSHARNAEPGGALPGRSAPARETPGAGPGRAGSSRLRGSAKASLQSAGGWASWGRAGGFSAPRCGIRRASTCSVANELLR